MNEDNDEYEDCETYEEALEEGFEGDEGEFEDLLNERED